MKGNVRSILYNEVCRKINRVCTVITSDTAQAGLDRTTVHSRANCLNNESITWWYLHPYNWRVISYHTDQGAQSHTMDTGFNYTWRAHAIHFKLYAGNTRATSTHLRQQIKDLKLAFNFKGVPQGNTLAAAGNITLLGVAPQGGFHEDKGGWSGAAQYFDAKSIGSCSYGVMNVKASNTAAELAIEDVTYSVNNKPTIITVEGNKVSGFLYKVDWYDDKNFHELECANMKYSSDKTNSVIGLAYQIDTNN